MQIAYQETALVVDGYVVYRLVRPLMDGVGGFVGYRGYGYAPVVNLRLYALYLTVGISGLSVGVGCRVRVRAGMLEFIIVGDDVGPVADFIGYGV